jgi:hypothetical protein
MLIVLLDYGSKGVEGTLDDDGASAAGDDSDGNGKGSGGNDDTESPEQYRKVYLDPKAGNEEGFNIFRTLVRNMRGSYSFNFVFNGFSNILNSVHLAANTYLPGSMRGAQFHQETLVLLWKFLEENEEFEKWIIQKEDINKVRKLGERRRRGGEGWSIL